MGIVDRLLASTEPSIRYRTLVDVLGDDPGSTEATQAREKIRTSDRVRTLLSRRDEKGCIPGSPYSKWMGAHWVLAQLADIGYPTGDTDLLPLRDQVYSLWLSPSHTQERVCATKAASYAVSGGGVVVMDGRARRCGSQEGNALWATLTLGIADERVDQLAANLVRWQWPDGGWNCDRNPEACHSSFHETILPLRGLSLHARLTGNRESRLAAERAAEVFLKRKMFRRMSNGNVIHSDMVRLHYPPFWHYDILIGLKVMAEAGLLADPRCAEALDHLESKRLPDGGFPAEAKYYKVAEGQQNGSSSVDWGGVSKTRMNEFVTVDALSVLRAAGRNGA